MIFADLDADFFFIETCSSARLNVVKKIVLQSILPVGFTDRGMTSLAVL